jgi:hypothetical protein
MLVVQRPLHLGLHGADPSGSRYLEFEVSVARDGNEQDITRLPQDDVVRAGEVDYLECECLGVVVAHVSEGERQGDLPKRDGLFAQDHSIEWVWAAFELVIGKPSPLKGVEVHELEVVASVHEGLSEPGRPDQRVNNEGKPPLSWLMTRFESRGAHECGEQWNARKMRVYKGSGLCEDKNPSSSVRRL